MSDYPLTPAAPAAFVTLAEAKERLNISDTADDARITDLIAGAVAAIGARWTLPTVPAVSATRHIWTDGCTVWTPELTAVTDARDILGNALTYITEPSGEGIARLILHTPVTCTVSVTGTWGRNTVPEDVKRGILVTVAVWYQRDVRGEESAYLGIRHAIPQETVDIFEARRFRRL